MTNLATLVAGAILHVLRALGLDVASLAAQVAGTVVDILGAVLL
jgi:hypothetical protein